MSSEQDYNMALRHLASPALATRNQGGDGEEDGNAGGSAARSSRDAGDRTNAEDQSIDKIGRGNTWNSETQPSLQALSTGNLDLKHEATNRVDLFTSGAYNNFETVTLIEPNTFVPPPRVVTTANKYKLFKATTDLEVLKFIFFKMDERTICFVSSRIAELNTTERNL